MAGDSNYPDVTLLLPMTGANNSTTFTDLSATPKTLTPTGDAKIVTTQTDPFGTSAGIGHFDGTGDYLSSDGWNLGVADFTLEGFVYFTALPISGGISIVSKRLTGSSNHSFSLAYESDTGFTFFYTTNGSTVTPIASNVFANINEWYFLAVVRSSGSINLFINGVSAATGSIGSAEIYQSTALLGIGAWNISGTPGGFLTGYLSNLRITNGVARYTSDFTPPTSPFVAGLGQLTGNVTEGSYSYISKWLVKAWKSFSDTLSKEQVVTGATYTVDLPTLDPYCLACTPYIDGKWEADKEVALGEFYTTSDPDTSQHLWEVTTAGTFDSTEATWNLSGTTTQGTSVLTYVGELPAGSILYAKIPS